MAAGKKGPLIPQSVAIRNTAIFSHVFQPLLLSLPAEQPLGRRAGLQIQTKIKRYQPMRSSEGDLHSPACEAGDKTLVESLPE